jgi:RNA polymerase sigma-70 factor (ECF subfamily)
MEGPTDRELVAGLARGDPEALGPLMERHQNRLYRIALSYLRDPEEALDVVQETFVKAFQGASSWDGGSEVVPWLARITINHAIDRYRRRKRRRASEEPLLEGDHDSRIASTQPSPEEMVRGRELSERISRALGALPEKQRAVFVLRHYDEMTLPEIADTLDMNLGTVKSSLHRALGRLRNRLRGL